MRVISVISIFFYGAILLICGREAESNLSFAKSVIGHRLCTSDGNDLEHVMNTDSSVESCQFALFVLPQHFIICLNFSFTANESYKNKRKLE